MNQRDFVIVGAGPAGLSAAHELSKRGHDCLVLEQDGQVGGLSKTVNHRGYRCDIGGHRFFTKAKEVQQLWQEVLPEDFLTRPRLSRIYYRGRFFDYPLRPFSALAGLGPITGARIMGSFAYRHLFPRRPEDNFETWVSNRFGEVLYSIFFKTYTEKVWGIPGSQISADWAAQRIRNLSLGRAVLNALGIGGGGKVASLIEEFQYPRHGPGQMYEAMADQAQRRGASIQLHHEVTRVNHSAGKVVSVVAGSAGGEVEYPVGNLISSMPLTELVFRLSPQAPSEVVAAARSLRYRSILTVNLVLRQEHVVPDTWVYLHAPEVQAGRIQLYKNWSPEMVPDAAMNTVGFEYFVWEGDSMWNRPDDQLREMAMADLRSLGLGDPAVVEDCFVVRYAKAYPVYDLTYQGPLKAIRDYLGRFSNVVCVGRYGQFRYNNMDHSIMTALLGVRRLLGESVDPWAVNADAEYLEEKSSNTGS